jgi:hypothetical protein
MIIFYTKSTDDIILASVVKHYNPGAILKEYSDNEDILSISKIHSDTNFIRVKDFKNAIERNYSVPKWLYNESIKNMIRRLLCHKNTNTIEVVSHLASYLTRPEIAFYSSIDKSVLFQNRLAEINRELGVLKRSSPREYRNDLLFLKADSEHDLSLLLAEELSLDYSEPLVVLSKESAVLVNASLLGFDKDIVSMSKFDSLKLRKPVLVKVSVSKNMADSSVATKLFSF